MSRRRTCPLFLQALTIAPFALASPTALARGPTTGSFTRVVTDNTGAVLPGVYNITYRTGERSWRM